MSKLLNKNLLWAAGLILSSLVYAQTTDRPYDFFTTHNILHLIGWVLVPRIMFFFFSSISGGILFWLGVLIFPHFMAAYWATSYYWDTNPVLCVAAWIVALSGEATEKYTVHRRVR